MKKIYTLIVGALLMAPVAFSQRLIDLEVTLVQPVTNAVINSGTQFNVNAIVKNVGTTTMKTSDTLAYAYALDGALLDLANSGQPTVFYRTGKQLAPNDTIILNTPIGITFSSSGNGPHDLGVVTLVINGSTDSAKDNNTANNVDTNRVIFANGTNGVGDLSASVVKNQVLGAYPNPATDYVDLKVKLDATADVAIRMVDLTGRVVYAENKGAVLKGEHVFNVPLKGLTTGYYFYQVIIDSKTFSDKIFIKE